MIQRSDNISKLNRVFQIKAEGYISISIMCFLCCNNYDTMLIIQSAGMEGEYNEQKGNGNGRVTLSDTNTDTTPAIHV